MPGTGLLRMYRSICLPIDVRVSTRKPKSAPAAPREPQDCETRPKVHNGGMFDWNDLKYFLAVARHGSTIAAGKALGTSQSTVHRRLEELERRIGQALVTRQQAAIA